MKHGRVNEHAHEHDVKVVIFSKDSKLREQKIGCQAMQSSDDYNDHMPSQILLCGTNESKGPCSEEEEPSSEIPGERNDLVAFAAKSDQEQSKYQGE